jgi:CBS domain containing-hemolysin-like protein
MLVPRQRAGPIVGGFERTHLPVAFIVDEFGDTQDSVSLTDVTSSIVGDLPGEPLA